MKTIADLSTPATVTRKLLEKNVQKQCVDWARARGYWARKFSSQSQRSVPDYLFSRAYVLKPQDWLDRVLEPGTHKLKFACEFKRPGTKPKPIPKYGVTVMSTEAQYEEQNAMRQTGWFVFECDDFEEFKRVVMKFEEGLNAAAV